MAGWIQLALRHQTVNRVQVDDKQERVDHLTRVEHDLVSWNFAQEGFGVKANSQWAVDCGFVYGYSYR